MEHETRTDSGESVALLHRLVLEALLDAQQKGVERSMHQCFTWARKLMQVRQEATAATDDRAGLLLWTHVCATDPAAGQNHVEHAAHCLAADAGADLRELAADTAEAEFRKRWRWAEDLDAEATPRDTEHRHLCEAF
jgi:hypothetical protein